MSAANKISTATPNKIHFSFPSLSFIQLNVNNINGPFHIIHCSNNYNAIDFASAGTFA